MQRLASILCVNLLRLCILFLPLLTAAVVVFGNPGHIKTAVQDSGIYNTFVGAVLEKSTKTTSDPAASALLADKGIQNVAAQTFTPGVLQQKNEQFIQSIYDWLDGRTPHLAVNIDFSAERQALVTNLAAYGQQRAAQLPPCTLEQLKQVRGDQNVLTIPCLPPGTNVAQISQQFSNDVINSAEFLKEASFKSDNLLAEQGSRVSPQLEQAPQAFQLFKWSPWILGGIIVLLGAAFIRLAPSRRSAVHGIAWMLIINGALLIIAILVYLLLFSTAGQGARGVDAALQDAITKAMATLIADLNRIVLGISGAYVIIGMGLLVGMWRWRGTAKPLAAAPADSLAPSADDETPKQSEEKV
jgi:hypothetical protein